MPYDDTTHKLIAEAIPKTALLGSSFTAAYVEGYIGALEMFEVPESDVKAALLRVLGRLPKETAEMPSAVPGGVSGPLMNDSSEVAESEAERFDLRNRFTVRYRQVKVVAWTSAPPPAGFIRSWESLTMAFPGIERRAVRRMLDLGKELGADESKLLLWWFHSGGTKEGLLKLPAPGVE